MDDTRNPLPLADNALNMALGVCGVSRTFPTDKIVIAALNGAPVQPGTHPDAYWQLHLSLQLAGKRLINLTAPIKQAASPREIVQALAAIDGLPDGTVVHVGAEGHPVWGSAVLLIAPPGELWGAARAYLPLPADDTRDPRRDPYVPELSGSAFVQQQQVWQ